MRLIRFSVSIFVVTLFCLIFIYTNTSNVHLAYKLEEKRKAAQDLLDRKNVLLYNLYSLKSPRNLDVLLSRDKDLGFAEAAAIVKLNINAGSAAVQSAKSTLKKKDNFFISLLTPKQEAEALNQ